MLLDRFGREERWIAEFDGGNLWRGAFDAKFLNITFTHRIGDDGVFDGRLQAVRREQLLYSITGAIHSGARFRQRPVKIGKCLADGVGQFRIREPRYVVKVDRKTRRFLDVVSHKHAAAACQKIEIYFCE